jgi:hypothetical protein
MSDPRRSPFAVDEIAQVPPDLPLAEELSSDIVVDMANLTTDQTGIAGTIFISTAIPAKAGTHFPAVRAAAKWAPTFVGVAL